jgi:large subunit ribosomal protein L28
VVAQFIVGLWLFETNPQEITVAANCDVCGKGPGFGYSVSHSHVRTKRRWNPNIQRVRAIVDGAPKRLHVCTSCLKAGKVTRRVSI